MDQDSPDYNSGSGSSILRYVLLAVAVIYVIASLYFIFDTRGRLATLEKAQEASIEKITHRLTATENNVKASTEALGQKLGMTQQDLQTRITSRTAELERQQRAAEKRLSAEQKEQMGQVTGEVATVKTELGGAKTDIASTKTDLEATKAKLERAMGDLGVQSGLIAHTREDLETLKHRGDRNYFEFSLQKNARPTPVSTVSLQLKKTDQKKGKFTLNIMADDRTFEKKDRGVAEPLQFYTGRDRMLYEIVILTVDKNKVTGYLSTPKGAPVPVGN